MIRMIAAVAENGVIGRDNKLPFDYPEDMKFFRKMTAGGAVIMGRKTFDSIGRPLPKRRNIIVTRSEVKSDLPGLEFAPSITEALDMASTPVAAVGVVDKDGNQINEPNTDNIWLIGGSSVYLEGLRRADEIYLTLIPETIEGEGLVYFPWINPMEFAVSEYLSLENSELKVAKYIRI
jgi:dihydrofolate reductase